MPIPDFSEPSGISTKPIVAARPSVTARPSIAARPSVATRPSVAARPSVAPRASIASRPTDMARRSDVEPSTSGELGLENSYEAIDVSVQTMPSRLIKTLSEELTKAGKQKEKEEE
ncbi:hypothetical protein ILUMI_08423 [Ignelater luminosus]|uniref:Uncharacterized protein n=1 Tax=Ignelater luminosus TaxID=2038154 RepID=A0A8K0DBC3_IGNLU|nr:hypothetical protein ILUMI_08423 [Ignelater luminosus]